MLDLESKESDVQRNAQTPRQSAKNIKILTPNQIQTRFGVASEQVQDENNSQKLKKLLDKYFILCIAQKSK